MLPKKWILAGMVGALFFVSAAVGRGGIIAEMSLGTPTVVGNVVSFEVSLDYDATAEHAGFQLGYFALDVSQSSPALSANNFAAFSFDLNAQFSGWVPLSGFTGGRVEFDDGTSIGTPVPKDAGAYVLGTLSVDLGSLGLTPSQTLTVSLISTGTEIGVSGPGFFDFFPVTFDDEHPGSQPTAPQNPGTNPVPEPATWAMFAICGALWGARRIFSRRAA